jgi:hypothetical protein
MLEKLTLSAERQASDASARQLDRLAQTTPPPGITVEATDDGVILSGTRLRRRMLSDPSLRNFGR